MTYNESDKISSSQLPYTPETRREAAEWVSNRPTSKHFTVGTFVQQAGRRGEIIGRFGESPNCTLTVRWDDGIVSFVKPIALNR
jgi:hypothetical protein